MFRFDVATLNSGVGTPPTIVYHKMETTTLPKLLVLHCLIGSSFFWQKQNFFPTWSQYINKCTGWFKALMEFKIIAIFDHFVFYSRRVSLHSKSHFWFCSRRIPLHSKGRIIMALSNWLVAFLAKTELFSYINQCTGIPKYLWSFIFFFREMTHLVATPLFYAGKIQLLHITTIPEWLRDRTMGQNIRGGMKWTFYASCNNRGRTQFRAYVQSSRYYLI